MISKRDIYLAIAGIVLIINVITAEHFYEVGKRKVALKSTEDSLVVVQKEKAIISKQRDSIGLVLKAASVRTDSTRTVFINAKDQTKIKGDSTYDSTGKFIQVLDKRIIDRIVSGEKHITNLEQELATAKFALKVDTVFIAKDSQEIGLHKSVEKLLTAPRGAWSMQVGGGYCESAKGGTPCVYVGLGYSVRF